MRRLIHRAPMAVASALLLGVFATACSTEDPTDTTTGSDDTSETSESPDASESPEEESSDEWFDQALFDTQDEQRSATFEGDPEQPYLQYIDGEMTDTSSFKSGGAKKACFANASISWKLRNEKSSSRAKAPAAADRSQPRPPPRTTPPRTTAVMAWNS